MSHVSAPPLSSSAAAAPLAKNTTERHLDGERESTDGADFTAALADQLAHADAIQAGRESEIAPPDIESTPRAEPGTADTGGEAIALVSLLAAQITAEGGAHGPASPSAAPATLVARPDNGTAPATSATLLPDAAPAGATAPQASAAATSPLLLTATRGSGEPALEGLTSPQGERVAPQSHFHAPTPQQSQPTAVLAAGIAATAEAAVEAIAPGGDAAQAATASSALGHTMSAHRGTVVDASTALRVDTAFAASRWGEDVAQTVVWLAGRNESRAELVLTPPQLGKLEVTLSVSQGGETSAHFVSPSPQVREALEQSLARLREVFAAAGISLGQTSVSADSPARDQRHQSRAGSGHRPYSVSATALSTDPAALLAQRRGLVDTFA